MVRWLRWHCPPDPGFEIRALAFWGRARYLSVTEAPHNTNFHTWMGKKHFGFFQTAETGNRTPDSGVKGSGANHYPRAPALELTAAEATYHADRDTEGRRTNSSCFTNEFPANTGHSPNAASMLGQRRRRWPNIEAALGEWPVFAGLVPKKNKTFENPVKKHTDTEKNITKKYTTPTNLLSQY